MSRHQELIDEALGRTTAVKINENKLKFQELMTVYQKFCNIYAFQKCRTERNELCNYPIDTKPNIEEDNFREITTLENEENNVENDLNAADTLPHMPIVQVFIIILLFLFVQIYTDSIQDYLHKLETPSVNINENLESLYKTCQSYTEVTRNLIIHHIQRYVQYCQGSESIERLYNDFQKQQESLSFIYSDEQEMLRRFKEANDSTKSDVLKNSDLYKINSFLYQTLASLDKFNSYLTVVQLSPLLYIYIYIIKYFIQKLF